jgi:hypothetical protein
MRQRSRWSYQCSAVQCTSVSCHVCCIDSTSYNAPESQYGQTDVPPVEHQTNDVVLRHLGQLPREYVLPRNRKKREVRIRRRRMRGSAGKRERGREDAIKQDDKVLFLRKHPIQSSRHAALMYATKESTQYGFELCCTVYCQGFLLAVCKSALYCTVLYCTGG